MKKVFSNPGKNLFIYYAVEAGLLAFFLSAFNISYNVGDSTVNIPWSLVFPILISLVYGPKGAWISAFSGGALFPFFLWPENGYANILTSFTILVLYLSLGWLSVERFRLIRRKMLWPAILTGAVMYTLFLLVAYRFGHNYFLSFNPAFWVDYSISRISATLAVTFFVKNIINYALISQFAETILHLPLTRRIFGLPYQKWMRNNTSVFFLSIAIAIFVWITFYILDYLLAEAEQSSKNYISLSFMVLFWSGGIVGRVLIHYNEQKLKANDRMLQSQEQLDTIVQNIPSVVYRCRPDKDWTMLMISQQIKAISGYPAEDFIENKVRSFSSIIRASDQTDQERSILSTLSDNKAFEFEYSIVDSDNKLHWISDKGVVKFNKNLNTWIIDGVLHDITDKKNTQTELENYKDKLELLVNERTKALHHSNSHLEQTVEKLKAAQSRLVQSEKMSSLGLLTAGIAHEINNPLNFISRGYEGLKNYLTQSNLIKVGQNKEFLASIENGVERTSRIIKGLNEFSRNNDNLNEKCDVHNILINTLSILQGQVQNKVEIQQNLLKKDLFVSGNVGKLHQVFINLITNSLQAIKDSGLIVISTYINKGFVVVEVADTGNGISTDNLKKIFDPFFTTKAPGEGTGLGLSISYSIINDHGGKVEAESKVGVGTSIKVYLPKLNN